MSREQQPLRPVVPDTADYVSVEILERVVKLEGHVESLIKANDDKETRMRATENSNTRILWGMSAFQILVGLFVAAVAFWSAMKK